MASFLRQVFGIDPAPNNGQSSPMLGFNTNYAGTPTDHYNNGCAFPSFATLAGSTLVAVSTISLFASTVGVNAYDVTSGHGAWSSAQILQTSGNCDLRAFYLPNAPAMPKGDSGFASASSSATIVNDTTKLWSTNQWVGYSVWDLSGNSRTITANTSTQLTVATGVSIPSGNYYVIGGMINVSYSANDDYYGMIICEIANVTSTGLSGHVGTTSSVSAGTNNISSGNTGTLAAGNYGVLGISFNDNTGSGAQVNTPSATSGATDGGGFFKWDIGQNNVRVQFKNATLATSGTLSSVFSANTSAEFMTLAMAFADSTASSLSQGLDAPMGSGGMNDMTGGMSALADKLSRKYFLPPRGFNRRRSGVLVPYGVQ